MPRKKRSDNLDQSTSMAKKKKIIRQAETSQEEEIRLQNLRARATTSREVENKDQRSSRLANLRIHAFTSREKETEDKTLLRLERL